jgi:hypothetical protein
MYSVKPALYDAWPFSGDAANPGWPASWNKVPVVASADAKSLVLTGRRSSHSVFAGDYVVLNVSAGAYFAVKAADFQNLFVGV